MAITVTPHSWDLRILYGRSHFAFSTHVERMFSQVCSLRVMLLHSILFDAFLEKMVDRMSIVRHRCRNKSAQMITPRGQLSRPRRSVGTGGLQVPWEDHVLDCTQEAYAVYPHSSFEIDHIAILGGVYTDGWTPHFDILFGSLLSVDPKSLN